MSGGGDKKRKRGLSDDDDLLWRYVTRNVDPDAGKPRVLERQALEADWPPAGPFDDLGRPPPSPPRSKPRAAPPAAPLPAVRKATSQPPAPQPVVLERKKARRIARGAEEIEARIDLHGMTQDAAHFALVGFIRRCHAEGHRIVLVITGKGGARSGARDDDGVSPRPRGVLRRNVPQWLAGAEIGHLVISYSAAHLRHGGDGALYVRLRKKP